MRSRILFLSGRPDDALRLSQMLRELPVELEHAGSVEQAGQRLRAKPYDVVFTEATLPDGNWLDVLHLTREIPGEIEVILTDSQADPRLWSVALNLGAYDLVAQPFYEPEVRRILYNACCHSWHTFAVSASV
jgi:DNA-binding NtrC family response regulator